RLLIFQLRRAKFWRLSAKNDGRPPDLPDKSAGIETAQISVFVCVKSALKPRRYCNRAHAGLFHRASIRP
ncbi:MAG: hypothetical protein RID59_19375, partial [Hoeflea sp.]